MTREDVFKVVPVLDPVCTSEIIRRCAEISLYGARPSRDSVLKHLHKLERLNKVQCVGWTTNSNSLYRIREKTWRRILGV